MKKLFISIILLFGIILFAKDSVVDDINTTVENINITKLDNNISIENNITQDSNITIDNNLTVEKIIQVTPVILNINIDVDDENGMLVEGNATKNLDIEVVLLHNNNERIVVDTKSNDTGNWKIVKSNIAQQLDDGSYDIYVTSKDQDGNKSSIASKKNLIRDRSINGFVVIKDSISEATNDKIINKKELKTFYIDGEIDQDAKIDQLYVINNDNNNTTLSISKSDLKRVKDGKFKYTYKNIDLSKIDDGNLSVVMMISDEHNNTLTSKVEIFKDIIAPDTPIVTNMVKEKNMVYGKVPNLLVFAGTAEVDSTIQAILFNTKYPQLKTMGKVKTPVSTKWVLAGKDFAIADLKDGQIKTTLIQIDKAGNKSKPLVIVLNKQRPLIFPKDIKIIPPENYMPIFTIKNIIDKVKAIAVSDQYIIAGTFEFLYYFDKAKGKVQKKIEIKDQWVDSMIIDNNHLILGLENGDIQIRDLNSSKLLQTITAHKTPILSLSIDKTMNRLISSSSNGDIKIWDMENYTQLYKLNKHQWDVTSMAIDGDILYTGSDDYSIKMWDIKSGKLLKNLKAAHDGAVNSLIVYKNMLISAGEDNMIFIRDLKSGKLLHILKGHRKAVNTLKINHDTLVSASSDRTLILWNLHTFQKIKQLRGHSRSILCMDINDENIVTGAMDYKIRIWGYDESLQGQGEIDETVLAKYDLIRSLDISSDIVTALGQTESELVFSTKGYVFFYNNITYKFSKSYSTLDKVFGEIKKDKNQKEDDNDEWGDEASDKLDSNDGWEDVSSDDEDDKPDWEAQLDKIKEQRATLAKTSLQWINDINIQGTMLSAALGYKNIKIWDMERNKAIMLLEGHESSVLSITKTDGYYVTSSQDGVVKVWDDESYALILSIDAHQWDVKTTVVDDGKLYTGSNDYSIKIWDMESGDLINTIKNAHNGNITKLLIVGNILISSSHDGTIKYRDKNSGKLLKVLSDHTAGVNTIVCDEKHLISGSDDTTIKIWDLKSGTLIKSLNNGHNQGVSALMITDDYIVSGGKDKKINIWKYYE